jgi:transcriptional regulator with XRE-family HTH domain
MSITAAQCRAARGMLAWSRDVLTERSKVSKRTIVDFERGARSPHASTLFAIQTAFENAGITFIEEDRDAIGILFRRPRGAVPSPSD